MNSSLLRIILLMITVGVCCALARAAGAAELHVATDGDDGNPGTKEKPLASLEAARDAIRKLKAAGAALGAITVWIHSGTYTRDRAFELGEADSGTTQSPVVYRGVAGERVRILGGRAISGFAPVTSPPLLQRLDEKARGHVLQINLRAKGIADFGRLSSRGFGRRTTPSHLELFFGGAPMTVARWPNEGEWENIAGFPEDQATKDGHGGSIGKLEAGFFYSGDRPRRWKGLDDVWVHGYWSYDWANSYERIESLDVEKRLIKTARPFGQYGFRKGQRFYFLNVLEELDQPGEYYLDRASGILYFWPPESGVRTSVPSSDTLKRELRTAPIDSAEIMVSLLEPPLISMNGVSHVTIRGLTLENTRGDAVAMRGGAGNRIAGCAIRLIGNWGVRIEGGRDNAVVGCDIENTGDGGVSITGGDRKTLARGDHFVDNCHFQKQGRWSKCYVPAIQISGVGLRASHNLIHDHPHCAILFGGNEHRIEYNEIHHIALETGDVGAIYAGRDYTYRGNAILYNYIHHTGGVGMGSMGVYMDDCVSGAEIRGNVFIEATRAVFLGGGRDHRVENNLFINCRPAVDVDGRGLDPSPTWHNMVFDFMKGRLRDVPRDLYVRRYPAIADLDSYYAKGEGIPPENNIIAHNIAAGGQWLTIRWGAKPEMMQIRDNWSGEDPGFVDRARTDFRLKENSPARSIGFKPIPFERIGLYNDEYRRDLSS